MINTVAQLFMWAWLTCEAPCALGWVMTREYLFMMIGSDDLDIVDEAKERTPMGALANADLRSIWMV
jgi:hypothetical protein